MELWSLFNRFKTPRLVKLHLRIHVRPSTCKPHFEIQKKSKYSFLNALNFPVRQTKLYLWAVWKDLPPFASFEWTSSVGSFRSSSACLWYLWTGVLLNHLQWLKFKLIFIFSNSFQLQNRAFTEVPSKIPHRTSIQLHAVWKIISSQA